MSKAVMNSSPLILLFETELEFISKEVVALLLKEAGEI